MDNIKNEIKEFPNISEQNKNEIDEWFKEFAIKKNILDMEKRFILIYGGPSSGKTLFAKQLLNNNGYKDEEPLLLESKSNKNLLDIFYQLIENNNIINIFNKVKTKIGLLFDDCDNFCSTHEKSFYNDLLTILSNKESGKKKKSTGLKTINTPIICIINSNSDKKVLEIQKMAVIVKLEPFPKKYLEKYVLESLNKINLEINYQQSERIVEFLNEDIRKINNTIESLFLEYFDIEHKHKLSNEEIIKQLNIIGKKNCYDKSIINLKKFFVEDVSLKTCISKYNGDKFLVPFMIHENFPNMIYENEKNQDIIINYLIKVSDNLSKNDIIQNNIFEKQSWDLNDYGAIFTIYTLNVYLSKYKDNYKENEKKNENLDFTTLLNKVSLFYTNRKVIQNIKINLFYDIPIFYFITDTIENMIETQNKNKNQLYMNIYNFIKMFNINPDDVDLIYRISRWDRDEKKKSYNSKIKLSIKKIMDVENTQ